jgi:hypothetical protein
MRIHIQWWINYHKKRTLIMNLGWGKKQSKFACCPWALARVDKKNSRLSFITVEIIS